MNLKKMLLLASMAMAAVAFAAPAAAQATVQLTDPEGVALKGPDPVEEKPGAKVTATSLNLKTATTSGTLECAKVTIHAEVTNPGPTHVTLAPLGEVTTETCKLNIGTGFLPVTIHDGTVGPITIETDGSGTAGATFISTVFNETYPGMHDPTKVVSRCHFAGNVSFQGTKGTDILHVGPSGLHATPHGAGPCTPTGGSISGSFTLETEGGTTVTIDHS